MNGDEEHDPLEAELAEAQRAVARRVDPTPAAALGVAIGVFVLIGAFLLPWIGGSAGWLVLLGGTDTGLLPRLFAATALGFGVAGSAVALATRRWGLAWLCALGCGFSVVDGVWAIWSRQVVVPEGGTGPGFGLVLAVLTVLVLAVVWVGVALRRS